MNVIDLMLGRAVRVLNALDAALTLYTVLVLGAEEANPIAAALIRVSPALFVVAKVLGVAIGTVILTTHGRTKTLAVAALLYSAAVGANLAIVLR